MTTLRSLWKRYWALPWKWKAGIAGGLLVAIFVVGAVTGGEDSQTTTPPADASTDTPAPTPSPTPKTTDTPRPTNTPAPTNTPKPTATPEPPTSIPGLTAADITKNLEPRGFKCSGPDRGQTMELWSCTSTSTSTIITVSFMGASATRIRSVSATVIVTAPGQPDSPAADFLGYLATLPYDRADPAKARAWVEANISAGGELVIGDARFTLSGPKGGRSLDIVAVGAR
ncbi:MAG: hypothetical protein AB7T37_04115 [Dehalococcoidia bacterium]